MNHFVTGVFFRVPLFLCILLCWRCVFADTPALDSAALGPQPTMENPTNAITGEITIPAMKEPIPDYTFETNFDGQISTITNRVIASTPIAHKRITPEVVITAEGAVGSHPELAHSLEVDGNLNRSDSVVMHLPATGDGNVTLQGHAIGVGLIDATGNQVWLGQIKDCTGEIDKDNRNVIRWCDAFQGIRADVVFIYGQTYFEQLVVLKENPVIPDDIDPNTARIFVASEFFATLEPRKENRKIKLRVDLDLERKHGALEMDDEILDWGWMRMAEGKAFVWQKSSGAAVKPSVPTSKSWVKNGNRVFLFEFADYLSLKPALDQLAAVKTTERNAMWAHSLPKPLPTGSKRQTLQLAKLDLADDSVVLDFKLENSALINVNFGGDTKSGRAVVGTSGDNWNSYVHPYNGDVTIPNLIWNVGSTPSPVSLRVQNAAGQWGFTTADPMYGTYIYPMYSGNVILTINNLPTGDYDFYMYGHGGAPTQNCTFTLSVNQVAKGSQPTLNSTEWQQSSTWVTNLQYVGFPSVHVNTGEVASLVVSPNASPYAVINGLQISAWNERPLVSAGIDQSIVLPSSAILTGTAQDDYYPPNHSMSLAWNKFTGYGNATLNPTNGVGNVLATTATISSPGVYQFRFLVGDTQLSESDITLVTVNPPTVPARDTAWVEDGIPRGGIGYSALNDAWNWVSSSPAPLSGNVSHQSLNTNGNHQHFFTSTSQTMTIASNDWLFCYIYLEADKMPSEVMLQWLDSDGSWDHRAYWGADMITEWGKRTNMGTLPDSGRWVRLSVPASSVGLMGRTVNGMAFALYNGRATWDLAGKSTGSGFADTDGDGLTDSDEVYIYHTDPNNRDTDGDGLTDSDEINIYHTDPNNADPNGDGIPEGWEVQNFTHAGIDSYSDPDGDGWCNLQEFQNGTNPNSFNTPPAPQGFKLTYDTSSNKIQLNWQPSLGLVKQYIITRYIYELGDCTTNIVSAGANSYSETFPLISPILVYFTPSYSLQVEYTQSRFSPEVSRSIYDPELPVEGTLVKNCNNSITLMVSSVAPGVTSLVLTCDEFTGYDYAQTQYDIVLANVATGAYNLPSSWTDNYGYYNQFWCIQGKAANRLGEKCNLGDANTETFIDGREHLRQNMIFLLRAANKQYPFVANYYDDYDGTQELVTGLTNYVYSDYYSSQRNDIYGPCSLDESRPLYDNYELRNFVLTQGDVGSDGFLNTGVDYASNPLTLDYGSGVKYVYVPTPGVTNVVAALNATNYPSLLQLIANSYYSWDQIGISNTNSNITLGSNIKNIYGLAYKSVTLANRINNLVQLTKINAGSSINYQSGYLYPETEIPSLVNTGYYFCDPKIDPFPGFSNFSITNQTPPIIVSIGDKQCVVAAYAKYGIANGYTNKYAYLGQYFDQAYQANSDGTRSTNVTGFLSPYGEFYATEPGKTFLRTKPDGVSTNIGECIVNVIKLQVDANHDGVMNISEIGPDNTSDEKPFKFWINNDRDDPGTNGNLDYDVALTNNSPNTDYSFCQIRTARNLEDFARLWVCGVPSLPSNQGYSVQLEWDEYYTGLPKMRLYWACETNGGISYLTNSTIAAQQITQQNVPIGEISPASPLVLPTSMFTNGLPRYFLFEAGSAGSGRLNLMILKGSDIIAKTSASLEFHDLKKYYEEVAITNVIQTWPEMVQQPTNSGFKVLSTAKSDIGDTKQMAVFVHGWRMTYADYQIFSQTMFKRLYWQGYKGKFSALRWPTRSEESELFPQMANITYNRSERIAFKSGTGTAGYLSDLRSRFPDYTISGCAHSMGGIVTVETLKELAEAGQRPVDNWVLMQAAVPAQCFDPSTPNFQPFLNEETMVPTPDVYKNYAAGITNALRAGGKIANFFNPDDYALLFWRFNQAYNAANLLGNGVSTMKPNAFFGYSTDGTNSVLRTNVWNQSFWSAIYGGYYENGPTRAVTNALELMPFVSRPRSLAVGAQPDVHGQIQGQSLNLEAQLGFGSSESDHSGQFNRNIQEPPIWPFFSQLITNLFLQK